MAMSIVLLLRVSDASKCAWLRLLAESEADVQAYDRRAGEVVRIPTACSSVGGKTRIRNRIVLPHIAQAVLKRVRSNQK